MYSEKVQTLREKLYSVAKADPKRRFHSLRDKIYRMDILWDAWKKVKANKGVAGVDGMKIEEIVEVGEEGFLERIHSELKANPTEYRASPVLRVYIDKPDGGKRPLGIPTVKDRVVQTAVKMIVEPIFEADFKDCSYGFRPDRSPEDARRAIYKWMNFGCENIIDVDIKSYFDSIPHDKLMAEVERRISDGWVLKLIRAWLRAKVIEPDGRVTKPKKGTPQGGVISPLLANIYLNQLDTEWEGSGMPDRDGTDAKLVRYADDLVIATSKGIDEPLRKLHEVLDELELELHPEKTRVVKAEEGFDFLGFHFVRRFSRKHKKKVTYSSPSTRSMQHAKSEIRKLTDKRQAVRSKSGSRKMVKPQEMTERLNRYLIGWSNYFRHSNALFAFRRIQRYVNYRVRKFLRYRRQRKGCGYKEYTDEFLFEKLGVFNLKGGIIDYPL